MCCFFTFCLFPPKHHRPVPMPTVSVRLFRCTGMEAAEMCHHWECRRGEEFCVWRDAQRKNRVGCRDVYKEELAGAQSPRLDQTHSHTHTLWSHSRVWERRADWKKEQDRISQIISHRADLSGLNIKQLSLNIVFHFILHHLRKNFWRQQIWHTNFKLKDLTHLL